MFEVQGGFKWPHFVLTAAILSEVDLLIGDEKEARFKIYNTAIHTWTKVRLGHVIALKDGDRIFLKGHDVVLCQDFDRLLSGSQDYKPHFFKNLPNERAHIRKALKEKKLKMKVGEKASSDSSMHDDDVEGITQATHKISRRPLIIPRRFKMEPSDFNSSIATFHPTLPHVNNVKMEPIKIKMEPMVIDLTISDPEDEAIKSIPVTMTRKRERFPHFLSSPSPSLSSSSSPSLGHSTSDDDGLNWPSDFYVVDIVHGFRKCDAARRNRKSVEDAFFKCFQVPFRRTTFYNHRRYWEDASEACRDEALRGGHSAAGSWKVFLKRSRNKNSTNSNVIERKRKMTKSKH